jgi:hypothetical protein
VGHYLTLAKELADLVQTIEIFNGTNNPSITLYIRARVAGMRAATIVNELNGLGVNVDKEQLMSFTKQFENFAHELNEKLDEIHTQEVLEPQKEVNNNDIQY